MSDFLFDDSEPDDSFATSNQNESWNILIIDDEPDNHQVTKLVLSNLRVGDMPLHLLSVFSGKEAKELL